jgi:hypothetical protein
MSTLRAFPYRTAPEALSLQLECLSTNVSERTDGTWDLYNEEPSEARFSLKIFLDAEALQPTLLPGESVEEAARLVIIGRGISSRRRSLLASVPVGVEELQLEFDCSEFTGRFDLTAYIVRDTGCPAVDGYAHLAGSVLAEVPLAALWFDEPSAPTGTGIETRWVDFREDDSLPDGNLFALRLEERPVILLNSGIPAAYAVLASKGTHGAAARIRDAVFAQIIHQVWSSLLGHCFLDVLRVGPEDPDTALERLNSWEAQVVEDWALDFVPAEQDRDTATRILVQRILTSGSNVLLELMPDVIQTRIDTLKGFQGLVKESHRFDGEE